MARVDERGRGLMPGEECRVLGFAMLRDLSISGRVLLHLRDPSKVALLNRSFWGYS